jgi:hypothetical protein
MRLLAAFVMASAPVLFAQDQAPAPAPVQPGVPAPPGTAPAAPRPPFVVPPGMPPGTQVAIIDGQPVMMMRQPAITAPSLPVNARKIVDESGRLLIDQLQTALDGYIAAGLSDDAKQVRTQITLLQQAMGLTEDAPRADRVSMGNYRDRKGESFEFVIKGSADLPVWGSTVYTDDTPIESAAVHAGVLKSGQTGPVRVTVLGAQNQFIGTKRFGIESMSFGPAPGSFRIETGPGNASRPTSLASFRGRLGETVVLPAIGAAQGNLWGSGPYTDDSSLGAAAVHSGILAPGEFGFVTVQLLEGQEQYVGVARNGVTSQNYGKWEGSIRVGRAPQPWTIRVPDDVIDASGLVPLTSLRNQPGLSFSLPVTGAAGRLRGTDIYADDSVIGAAAVHAGILRMGEKGYVTVTILPGQQEYAASEQNGIKSIKAGPAPGSFRISR